MRSAPWLLVACMLIPSCSNPGSPGDGSGSDRRRDTAPVGPGIDGRPDTAPGDGPPAESRVDGAKADVAVGLPFPYTRPAVGAPVSASELTTATDRYLELLKKTRYFDVLDERVHGWPQSDPKQRYWYGTWWSGCGLLKAGGKVTLEHVNVGADNNGIATSAMMEGTCYGTRLWSSAKLELLTRRLLRGLHSWIMAMERSANDPAGTLLARVSYPEPVTSTDGGRTVYINYAPDRPGIDSYCQYVHIPANPHWGDIWIKNNRSKDDIGHMLRAVATLSDCAPVFGAATALDRQAMEASYVKWAKRVEADGWAIATYDKSGALTIPSLTSTMSRFITVGNAECNAVLSLKLFSQGTAGTFVCGNGIHPLEWVVLQKAYNGEIIRSFHEAAVKHALLAKQSAIAQVMLAGLTARIDDGMKLAEAGPLPDWLTTEQLFSLLVHAASVGVPLTWREVRWLHKRIDEAYTSYVTNTAPEVYRVFDPSTPDGAYSLAPSGSGIDFKDLALLIGTCAATFRNPTSNPVLDCARLKAWTP
jgi:hypothetical protein